MTYDNRFNGLGRNEVERIAADALREVAHLNAHLTHVQTRCTELLLENRELRGGIALAGWRCSTCQAFNGSEKEQLTRCRCCDTPRPT